MARTGGGELSASDIEIGAVEIKNGSDDTRMDVETAGADAKSNTANTASVMSRLLGFNSSTWDRLRTVDGAGDGGAPKILAVGGYAYNGSTWDRMKSGVKAVTTTLTGWLNSIPFAIYNATPTTRTDGQGGPLEADNSGNLKTTLATAIAGEDLTNDVMKTEQRFSYSNMSADTLVKSGAGFEPIERFV